MSDAAAPFAAGGISVIVPVYNEAAGVGQTLAELSAVLGRLGLPYEILVVDDGSTDGSGEEIAAISDPMLRVIAHETNRGYGASLSEGMCQARYGALAIVDADGTYPVERIPELVAGLDWHSMVVGTRVEGRRSHAAPRRAVKWWLRRLAELVTGQAIPDLNSGLRAMRREAILPLEPILPQRFSWTSTVTVALLLRGHAVAFVPIAYRRRLGRSKVHPIRDTLGALRCILRAATSAR